MSHQEVSSLNHLRKTLNDTCWTLDPHDFIRRVRNLADESLSHLNLFGRIPKDMQIRIKSIMQESLDIDLI